MKRILHLGLLTLIGLALILPNAALAKGFSAIDGKTSASAAQTDDDDDCTNPVNLSDEQKKKLSELYDKIYESHKALLESSESYGLLTRTQKEERLKRLKSFISYVKTHNYQWCSEFEDDEKEWEWFERKHDRKHKYHEREDDFHERENERGDHE